MTPERVPRGLRWNLPYLNGVYVAVGAVSDLRLVVDGPYCVVQKAELHMAHDPASGLVRADGVGRIGHTDLQLNQNVAYRVTVDRGRDIVQVLVETSRLPDTGLVLLTSMDFHQIVAAPLERYRRAAEKEAGAPIALLPARSLEADWLQGYAAVLERVAQVAPLPPRAPEPGGVAVVGPLFDRRAGDVFGNQREVSRLLEGLGLRAVAVWPDGGPIARIAAAAKAELIVSLPYAREAARVLANRLETPLIEAPLPLGIRDTVAFVQAIAAASGRDAAARDFLARELRSLDARVRSPAYRYLAGRRVLVEAEPHIAAGLLGLANELGLEVAGLVVMGSRDSAEARATRLLDDVGASFEPLRTPWPAAGPDPDPPADADVVVAPTLYPRRPGPATWVSFGYPNFLSHPIRETPYLGFEGVVWWVERLVEACQTAETYRRGTLLGGEAGFSGDSGELW